MNKDNTKVTNDIQRKANFSQLGRRSLDISLTYNEDAEIKKILLFFLYAFLLYDCRKELYDREVKARNCV